MKSTPIFNSSFLFPQLTPSSTSSQLSFPAIKKILLMIGMNKIWKNNINLSWKTFLSRDLRNCPPIHGFPNWGKRIVFARVNFYIIIILLKKVRKKDSHKRMKKCTPNRRSLSQFGTSFITDFLTWVKEKWKFSSNWETQSREPKANLKSLKSWTMQKSLKKKMGREVCAKSVGRPSTMGRCLEGMLQKSIQVFQSCTKWDNTCVKLKMKKRKGDCTLSR